MIKLTFCLRRLPHLSREEFQRYWREQHAPLVAKHAKTLGILVLGLFAFCFSTFGGVVFAKFLNLILPAEKKINPCIGAAGVSAVPMAARVVQGFVSEQTNGRVNPLMAAMGPNVAGVIGSAVAAGVFLALLG